MRLLLDTHVWIWYLIGSSSLASEIRSAIEADENEVFLSPISVWETLVLAAKGRLELQPDPTMWVRSALERFPVIEAPLNHEIAVISRTIALPHPDPADRFLAATAQVYKARLVTYDLRLVNSRAVDTYP